MDSEMKLIFMKNVAYTLMSSSVLVATQETNITHVFTDVLWIIFTLIGLIVSLTVDNKDSKVVQKISTTYIIFSIAISIGISMLVAVAKSEALIGSNFWFYALTIAGSTFAPFIARKLIISIPKTIDNSVNNAIRSKIESLSGNSSDTNTNTNTEEENEH